MEESTIYLIIAVSLTILFLIYDTYRRRPRRTIYITRELLVCTKCNYRVERDAEPGDFIGLLKGKCPSCGGDLKITGIYAVEKK